MLNNSIAAWLEQLADKQPAPGGGAAAAFSAAIGASLIGMVTIYTTGAKWKDRESRMWEINEEVANLRIQALDLIDKDAAAFAEVASAYSLPKATAEQKQVRSLAIQAALVGAAEPPCATAELASRLVDFCEEIIDQANPNVISDVAVAAAQARAALDAAIVNIEINMASIADTAVKESLGSVVRKGQKSLDRADKLIAAVRKKLAE